MLTDIVLVRRPAMIILSVRRFSGGYNHDPDTAVFILSRSAYYKRRVGEYYFCIKIFLGGMGNDSNRRLRNY